MSRSPVPAPYAPVRHVLTTLAFIAVAAVFGFFLWEGLSTGVIEMKGANPSRTEDPLLFWLMVVVDVVGLAVMLWVARLAAKGLWRDLSQGRNGR